MLWLEVGCPHCPTVLTFPHSSAGRSVRCPECGRAYLIPEPPSDAADATSAPKFLQRPRRSFDEDPPPVMPTATPATPLAKDPIAEAPPSGLLDVLNEDWDPPLLASATLPLAEPAMDAPAAKPAANAPLFSEPPARPTAPAIPAANAPRPTSPSPRGTFDPTKTDPHLAVDSPLPEVPILDPPRRPFAPRPASPPARAGMAGVPADAASRAMPTAPVHRPSEPSSPQPRHEPSQTLRTSALPPGVPPASMESDHDAQVRMHRARRRATANLILFVGGTLVMIAFAFLVVRFSRRG